MLKNYLKTALRNLWRSKGFSAINIVGLAIGLATCLLIILYVTDELGYDRFNTKSYRIQRLDGDIVFGGNHFILASAPPLAGPSMLKDYPEVEQYCRFINWGGRMVKKGDLNIKEDRVIYADSTLFDVFTLPMIAGDPRTALMAQRSVVLTEKTALKYFGGTDIIGRNLVIDDSLNYKVTGVIRDIPAQSHFHYDLFLPMSEIPNSRMTDQWLSNNFPTYIVLKKGVDPKKLEAKLGGMVTKYIAPLIRSVLNQSMTQFEQTGNHDNFSLTPLTAIHLHSNKTGEMDANGSIQYVYIFSAIAAFILLIACVNFMNLSTARSSNRAKEVGVRKVLGSLRSHLITQFITESLLISVFSIILALGLAWLILPLFNGLANKQITLGLFTRPWLIPCILVLTVIVGLLAGSYPAFFLSAFRPIAVLKGNMSAGFKMGWLRNSLVVFQFGISMFLMIGTVVIYKQLSFIRSKELGFDRDHVLVLKNTYPLGDGIRAFRNDLQKLSGVQGATMTSFLPVNGDRSDKAIFLSPDLNPNRAISMQWWDVDENYVPVLGMKMMSGRNFSASMGTDSTGIIINEAAARMMGVTDPIGQKVYDLRDIYTKELKVWHVVGVVKNFNFSSMRDVVSPVAIYLGENRGSLSLRINSTNIPKLLTEIESRFHAMAPGQPFSYSFMEDDFNNSYKSEQQMGKISLSFSLLAICIACLGLFGLAAYAAEQRTREIGIRKVLGATVSNIIGLLSKDFLRLVLVAAVVASPFAWWAMHRWLQDFAYRVDIGWTVFALAGILSAAIALFTVSFQAIRAALANPVESLRSE